MSERKSIPLRMSPELYKDLKAWAEQDLRSVNAQIEMILRDAIEARKGKASAAKRAS